MDFFDNIGNKLTQTGQRAKEAANNLTEGVRLTQQLGELSKKLQELYGKIGEQYYALHGNDPDPDETMVKLCEETSAICKEIKALQQELQQVKNVRVCPDCGQENAANVNYCARCGAKLPEVPAIQKTVFCPECGTKLMPGTKFCIRCGTKLS